MTAHQLAKRLLAGPDLPVHFSYNYGDRWRTQVAPEAQDVDVGMVRHSAYHDMPMVIDEESEKDEAEEDEASKAIIIS